LHAKIDVEISVENVDNSLKNLTKNNYVNEKTAPNRPLLVMHCQEKIKEFQGFLKKGFVGFCRKNLQFARQYYGW